MSLSAPYLKRNASGTFYVHWTENRIGKRVSTRTKDLAAAKAFLAQWLMLDGSGGDPDELTIDTARALLARWLAGDKVVKKPPVHAEFTVADLWPVYRQKHVEKNVVDPYQIDHAWRMLAPEFGGLVVPDVSQEAIDSYVQKRTKGTLGRKVVPSTAAKELASLIACINFCAKKPNKLIQDEWVEVVKLPAPSKPRERVLRKAEINALFEAAKELRQNGRMSRVERFLWLAFETTARQGAILELTWDRVDFVNGEIDYVKPGRRVTKKRRTVVPISKTLRPILKQAYDERINGLVLDNSSAIWASIQSVAIRAGLGGGQALPKSGKKPSSTGISAHVFRHTAATRMASASVAPWKIAKVLGNTTQVVEKVYAKWLPRDHGDVVDAISGGLQDAAE